jgi:hypothetical protein
MEAIRTSSYNSADSILLSINNTQCTRYPHREQLLLVGFDIVSPIRVDSERLLVVIACITCHAHLSMVSRQVSLPPSSIV